MFRGVNVVYKIGVAIMVYGLWGRIWFTFACLCTVEPICNGEIALAIVIIYMKVERIKIKNAVWRILPTFKRCPGFIGKTTCATTF